MSKFRNFYGALGGEAREDLFETYWGFRGSGVSRLLYMGIAVANKTAIEYAFVCYLGLLDLCRGRKKLLTKVTKLFWPKMAPLRTRF